MNKLQNLSLLLIALLSSFILNAQSFDGAGDSKLEIAYISPSGFKIGYDEGLNDFLSINSSVSYNKLKAIESYDTSYFYDDIYLNVNFKLRVHLTYLLDLPERIDPYFGVGVGSSKHEAHLGTRYMISEGFGFFGEYNYLFGKGIFSSGDTQYKNHSMISAGIIISLNGIRIF